MITRRAPGKLFIAGEYAVLEPGQPAVVVAVDRYVSATVAQSYSPTVVLTSTEHGDGRLCCRRDQDRLRPINEPHANFDYVLAAVDVVERLVVERGLVPRAFELHTAGTDFVDSAGVKLGLGSSAAVTVAVIDALGEFYALELTPAQRYRLAMLATAAVNPHCSGGDVAAATWRGWVAYRSPDRDWVGSLAAGRNIETALCCPWQGAAVEVLRPPRRVRLLAGWTGQAVSTPAMIEQFRPGQATIPSSFRTDSAACVEGLISALTVDDVTSVQHEIRRAAMLLDALDAVTELGIKTPRLDALCRGAALAGAAAKPSGAGGGDCGIAIVDRERPDQADQVAKHWREAGIRLLPLHTLPTREGIR
ncbi:phosphomevalonate kinase [Nocardia brasiliensis]|uniref:phosphomevalonate kinase n=1 Tax=Nocardia brasiliensis TaxID=37326 RepID=UPI0024586BB4|nr:phosphomevalonate kinase [Nocardia brasiliensis]